MNLALGLLWSFSFSKFLAFGSERFARLGWPGVRGIVWPVGWLQWGSLSIRAAAPQHGRFLNPGMPGEKGKEKRENDALSLARMGLS